MPLDYKDGLDSKRADHVGWENAVKEWITHTKRGRECLLEWATEMGVPVQYAFPFEAALAEITEALETNNLPYYQTGDGASPNSGDKRGEK